MKIFLIGGTGLLGSEGAKELIKRGTRFHLYHYHLYQQDLTFRQKWNYPWETIWKCPMMKLKII
jgi:nucleoside-diphosphate-sugar epimerase